jgi:hypothetical protein
MANANRTLVEHRLDVEGADPLLLAGVNDGNMQELARIFGIRVVLRGDRIILSGEIEPLERAVPVIQHLIELARLRSPFDVSGTWPASPPTSPRRAGDHPRPARSSGSPSPAPGR